MVTAVPFPLVVGQQNVVAQVVAQVAPHRMDVVAVVDGVVGLDQQVRGMDAVVMRLTCPGGAGPGEVDFVGVAGRKYRALLRGHLVGHSVDVVMDQITQQPVLRRGQFLTRDAGRGVLDEAQCVAIGVGDAVLR